MFVLPFSDNFGESVSRGKQGEGGVDLGVLEDLLGYRFKHPELLERALTHSSYANELGGMENGIRDNERLEFLGDAVLGLVISDLLFRSTPEDEGALTRAKSHLVSARSQALVAPRYRLGEFLRLGRGEEKDGGRTKGSLLANALEAVVGAVYLDGGMGAARRLITEAFGGELRAYDGERLLRDDPKSYLQELLQARELPAPAYAVVETSGPDHSKDFIVELRVGASALVRGRGRSKKSAEQAAARSAIAKIETGELAPDSLGAARK